MLPEQSQKKFSKIKRVHIFFLLTFFLTSIILYCIFFALQITKVELSSSQEGPKVLGIENYYHKSLFLLQEGEVQRTLLENNPMVKKVQVEKKYPDTLKIQIETDKSVSLLAVDQGYFALSPRGRILLKTKSKQSNVPIINYYQKLHYSAFQTGDVLDLKDILTALHFLKKTQELGLKILSIDINGFNMIRLQLENKMIFFTTEKSTAEQDYELETLIRQFKIEGRDFKMLDFRFDKPIITLQ
ncbi:hypothetical protein A3G67_04310 [Candidatus Roizmanbacteria bacterium RIFCSPLOWO2_12_FULL_40_12]|uniref:POTRA domain-containing protein n=1 Tax=Candidatus Roizmanbacteria bacterium RIFCSPLOWO2_01_FULL_40_42 TaxID=1802066 RepID=A0A1F7J4U2_9BACT|nr:MAG: hypothetical protein A2779_04840 [Candidatus Roizmanbacteria bacterium RIFCSPHIGHO2_01_FULL_40_98]OGK27398.1 MAG: hypothetical protein A3C31_05165 [Candidatus Roizmanbacteria bacterium RIFCSPHIGHO2_02_FULL_40_53]OGK30729.1 MAG: hypothetical protein A2W49_01875 [Candidatus Roizmanbacteria bacterium RIFCSPHIGHO2_12_41_18]OGK36179.1 MAG: hypothetical protein A3E69_01355 [Candidatus Roizmanbacteria bacterium RIFCSPHIGHO2_12_FULL_40_130]OGK50632.1 MAG: hypothetical protein A3B50_02520 [Candi